MLIRRNSPGVQQLAACQANAHRSRGPATPAGKRQSARNSMKHGLAAASIPVTDESRAVLHQLRSALSAQFHPSSPAENRLIDRMAAARWRLAPIEKMEDAIFSPESDPKTRAALAGRWVGLLNRYGNSLERQYQRAFSELIRQRIKRQSDENFHQTIRLSH